MAYHFPTSPALSTPATGAAAIFLLKSTMKAAGFTIGPSSDGTTAGGGDVLSTGAAGAGGLGNALAYFVATAPSGEQFCFQRGASNQVWYVKSSPGGFFTGGNATQVPTASDQEIWIGLGPDSAPTFAQWFNAIDGAYSYSCCVQDVAPHFWDSFAFVTLGGPAIHAVAWDGIQAGTGVSTDADRHVGYANVAQGFEFDIANAGYLHGTWAGAVAALAGVSWPFYPGNGFNPDSATGKDDAYPLVFFDPQVAQKGAAATLLWLATGNAANPRSTGKTFTLTTAGDHILVGFCLLPWDGSLVNGSPLGLELGLQIGGTGPAPTPPPPAPPAAPSGAAVASRLAAIGAQAFGQDFSCLPDLRPTVLNSGLQNLAEAILRRLQTPRGGLFYDLDYGTDLREWVNGSFAAADILRYQGLVQDECEKDDRVLSAEAQITPDGSGGFQVAIGLSTGIGPFNFVVGVSQASVSLLDAPSILLAA